MYFTRSNASGRMMILHGPLLCELHRPLIPKCLGVSGHGNCHKDTEDIYEDIHRLQRSKEIQGDSKRFKEVLSTLNNPDHGHSLSATFSEVVAHSNRHVRTPNSCRSLKSPKGWARARRPGSFRASTPCRSFQIQPAVDVDSLSKYSRMA